MENTQLNLFLTKRPAFFNTTNLPHSELKVRELKADSQNAKILECFANNPNIDFTPCEIWQRFKQWPLTSIRRSITTLTDSGYLVKTSVKRPGIYGELNYTWTLKRKANV